MSQKTPYLGIDYAYAVGENPGALAEDQFRLEADAAAMKAFGQDVYATAGLVYAWLGGNIPDGNITARVAGGTIALTPSATSYVERTALGVVSKNTTGFTADGSKVPMAKVVCSATAITSVEDWRPATGSSGGSGTAAWGAITGTLADQTDLNSALGGKEASLGNPGTSGYVLSSTTAGVRTWVAMAGGGTWGSITGTLSSQTDLNSALGGKSDTGHTHTGTYEPVISAGTSAQAWKGNKAWGSVDWSELSGKPSTFAPAAHASDHAPGGADALPWSTIHGRGTTVAKPAAAAGNAGHLYFDTDLGKLQRSSGTAWQDVAETVGAGSVAWGSITGTLTDQTDLGSALSGKAASSHTHAQADVTNLVTDLAGKASSTHTHAQADVTNLTTDLAGKEPALGNPGTTGYVLSSTTAGVRSWIAAGGGSASWGSITGTLSAQTDLNTALTAKAPKITPTFKDGSYWGDDSYAQQTFISPTYPNTINSGYHQDSDGTTLWLNYLGYNNGNTRYRTVSIANGRSGAIATFTGAASPTIDFLATLKTYALKVQNNASCMFAPYSSTTSIPIGFGCYFNGSAWVHANGGVNSSILNVDTDAQNVKWYAATNSTSGTWNIADAITLWTFAGRWQQGVDLPASAGLSIASGAPGTTTTKLYQVSGALYWDGGKVKMLAERVQDVTSTFTSITPDVSTADLVTVRGASSAITLNNPTGTPLQGQKLIIRIKDNGTARAISYGTEYRNMGATKPTTTVLSKTLYLGLIYNSTDTKWDLVAVSQEA